MSLLWNWFIIQILNTLKFCCVGEAKIEENGEPGLVQERWNYLSSEREATGLLSYENFEKMYIPVGNLLPDWWSIEISSVEINQTIRCFLGL